MSLRLRLVGAAALVIAVALAVSGLAMVVAVRHALVASLDDEARTRVGLIAQSVAAGSLPTSPLPAAREDAADQVVGPDGVVAATANIAGAGVLFADAPGQSITVRTVDLPQIPDAADSYRLATVRTDNGYDIYVALPSDDVTESVARVARVLAIGLPVLFLLLVGASWVLVGRTLRPVERARVRQREFVADAAHELRSPLASMRAQLEVAAEYPDPARWPADVDALTGEVVRMGRLVDDLLEIARTDEAAPVARRPVDLDDVALRAVARTRGRDGVVVSSAGVSAARVSGDPVALERVAGNLLDNAVRHATSTVTVSVSAADGWAVLTVADDGSGVPAAERDRVFERFARSDAARSREGGGVGLGLAIVRGIVVRHGGHVRVEDNGPGARFVVRLPMSH
jgi:signal transduction histidine kinase